MESVESGGIVWRVWRVGGECGECGIVWRVWRVGG